MSPNSFWKWKQKPNENKVITNPDRPIKYKFLRPILSSKNIEMIVKKTFAPPTMIAGKIDCSLLI